MAPLTAREFFALSLAGARRLQAERELGIAHSTVYRVARGEACERDTLDRLEEWSRGNATAKARGVYLSADLTEQALRDGPTRTPKPPTWVIECPVYHCRFTRRSVCQERREAGDAECVRCRVSPVTVDLEQEAKNAGAPGRRRRSRP